MIVTLLRRMSPIVAKADVTDNVRMSASEGNADMPLGPAECR
jgi:hypothetical protein